MSRQGAHKREKRLKRLFGVSTIILSLLIAFIPNFVYAANSSGKEWGVEWTISGNTLTISPAAQPHTGTTTGQMNDNWEPPITGTGVTKVIVASGVTNLGTKFCEKLKTVSNVTINSPATIPTGTISGYGNINTLEFGEGVTRIEDDAVTPDNATSNINRLVLPASLTSFNYDNFCYNDGTDDHYNIGEIVTPTGSAGEKFIEDINEEYLNGNVKNSNNLIALYHDNSGSLDRESKTYIKDLRASQGNTGAISASTAGIANGDYILTIKDTTSTDLKGKLPSEVKDSVLYDLTLTDDTGAAKQITCTITLPIPNSWDTSKGVTAFSLRNSALEKITATPINVSGVTCAQFTTDHFSDYAVTNLASSSEDPTSSATTTTPTTTTPTTTTPTTTTPTTTTPTTTNPTSSSSTGGKKSSSSAEKTYTITVKDERTEKSDSRYISAKVSNLEQNLVLVVKDSDGAEIQKSLVVPNKGIVKYVDLDLQNDKGEGVVGYGTCTVVLPIPQEMDLTKGSVKVMAFDANNALKEISSKIVEVSGKKCVKFNPPHFSEFALVYTPFSGNTTNGNGNGNAGGTSGNRAATGNKVVMPKTGGGDEIRYILSAFLFLFGTVQLITSVTKKVKTA